jgi:hypothetical protein
MGLALVGGAGGLAVTPAKSVAMTLIPQDRSGMASGILSAQRALGSTAGFAIMGSVLAAVVALTLPGKFEPYLPNEQQRDDAASGGRPGHALLRRNDTPTTGARSRGVRGPGPRR